MTLAGALQAFHFLRPLWLLALLPLWGLAVWLARRRSGAGNWSGLIDPELLAGLRLEAGAAENRASPWRWLALAWTLAVAALAGPTWQHDVTTGYRGAAAWVLVLDLSPSMAASDLSPDRVTRARYALDDLLGAARDARVGLVVFSDEPYTVTPLTEDVATVRALLSPLAPDIMPSRGDNLAPALAQAAKLLAAAAAKDQRVIVLTDGFADPAAAFAGAAQLRSAGVVLDVVGIGTPGGAPLRSGDGGFDRDIGGQPVLARLDADRLQHLAAAGGGDYVDLATLPRLVSRLQTLDARAEGAVAAGDIQVEHWREAGVWLLPVVLLLAALLSRRGWL